MSCSILVLVPVYTVHGWYLGTSVNHYQCFPVLKRQSEPEWMVGKAAGSSIQLVFMTL